MSADPYELPSSHRPVVERGTYIPSWYKPHEDLSVQVVDQDGGDLGFTVADVLPERRWAIEKSGKLMSAQEYEKRYQDWIGRVCVKDGRIVSMNAVNKYFDVTLETVPPVDEFVDAVLDPMRPGELRYVPIRMQGISQTNARTKIRPIYNSMGQKVVAGAPQPAPAEGFEPVPVNPDVVKEAMAVVPCGKEVKVNRVNQHKSICKSCKMAMKDETVAA